MSRFLKYLLIATGALLSVTAEQLRADTIDQFTYTVTSAGGNTTIFTWQLPPSPSGPGLSSILGSQFSVMTGANDNPANGTILFFALDPLFGLFGGLQIQDAATNILADGFGALLYSGTEDAPTFTPGTYSLTDDFIDQPNLDSATLTITQVQVAPVPEPSSVFLLGSGLLVLAVGLALKKAVS